MCAWQNRALSTAGLPVDHDVIVMAESLCCERLRAMIKRLSGGL